MNLYNVTCVVKEMLDLGKTEDSEPEWSGNWNEVTQCWAESVLDAEEFVKNNCSYIFVRIFKTEKQKAALYRP